MNKVKAFSGASAEEVAEKINQFVEDEGAKIEGQPTIAVGGFGGSAVQAIVAYSGGKKKEDAPKKEENPSGLTEAERVKKQLEGEVKTEKTTLGDLEGEKEKQADAGKKVKGESTKKPTGGKK